MRAARGLAGGTVFVAAAVGLAFHAAAEPPVGRYTATVIDASGHEIPAKTTTLVFHPCGSGCTSVLSPDGKFELHLQGGSTWSGDDRTAGGQTCADTLSARLVWTRTCAGPAIRAQLTKSG